MSNKRSSPSDRPSPPDLPAYLLDPLERQSPDRLDAVAEYAAALAAWKRDRRTAIDQERAGDAADEATLDRLDDRGVSTDPDDYEGVPTDGAYVTVKETKPGYRYYYWQWRSGDGWANEYIAPVDADRDPDGDG